MRILLFCVCALAFSSTLPPVHAWGNEGHMIIAAIAQYFLTPAAQDAINKQLPTGSSLPNISTIPDYYDSLPQGAWSAPLHYVNLPVNATDFVYDIACPENQCVVGAIYNFSAQLKLRKKNITAFPLCQDLEVSDMSEPCPLEFVVHFVGDVHQPLHVAYGIDEGGNLFVVNYFGTCNELHATWDYLLITTYNSDTASFAQELIDWLVKNPDAYNGFAADTEPQVWANESFGYARNIAYNFMPGYASLLYAEGEELPPLLPPHLNFEDDQVQQNMEKYRRTHSDSRAEPCEGPLVSEPYFYRNIRRVKQRLAAAGVRLATLLNNIYNSTSSKN